MCHIYGTLCKVAYEVAPIHLSLDSFISTEDDSGIVPILYSRQCFVQVHTAYRNYS